MKQTQKQRGFTLLEILVAISIFALIGTGSYSLLTTVIDAKTMTDYRARTLTELQNTFFLLEQDMGQLVVQHPGNNGSPLSLYDNEFFLSFLRSGRSNPLQVNRSDLITIGYVLEFNDSSNTTELIRYYWDAQRETTDYPVSTDDRSRQVLATGISEITLRYMWQPGSWDTSPDQASQSANASEPVFSLPMAIELLIQHESLGELRMVFSLPRGFPSPDKDDNDDNGIA